MMRSIAFAGPLLAACVSGCSTIPERLNGTYRGNLNVPLPAGIEPRVADQYETVKLIARMDGTASLSDRSIPVEGELTYGSKSATFTPRSILGQPVVEESKPAREYTATLTPAGNDAWIFKTAAESLTLKKVPDAQ